MFALVRKEFQAFFSTLLGYVVVSIFLLLNGLFLWVFPGETNVFDAGQVSLGSFFIIAPWVLMIVVPAITMRSFSEETKMANATQEKSIDHILYSTNKGMKLLQTGRDWGPKNQNKDNVKSNGCLSDHPWVWCELEISEVD